MLEVVQTTGISGKPGLNGDLQLLAQIRGVNLEVYTRNANLGLGLVGRYNHPGATETVRILHTAADYTPSESNVNPLTYDNHYNLLVNTLNFNLDPGILANPAVPFLTEATWNHARNILKPEGLWPFSHKRLWKNLCNPL